jgi:conjugal transfer pilus assembly protein TraB
MENKITQSAKAITKKQQIIMIGTIGVVLVIFMSFMIAGGKKKPDDLSKIITNSKNRIILEDSSKGIKAEDRWLQEGQEQLNAMDSFMKESVNQDEALNSRLSSVEKQNQELEQQRQIIDDQANALEEIKSQLKDLQNSKNLSFNQGQGQGNAANNSPLNQEPIRAIASLDLNLETTSKSKKGIYNINDYIPAGAYAKAVIISGVDASVGISSQSDPRPVLLRVKSPAISSIYDGNVQKVDLTGCLITGAASGDLSSEKIYVKLVNMTCGKGEDLITEIPVKGYVAGQGKSGIRGNVISREGDLLAKSFLAGLVSGFGQGLSEKVAPPLAFSNGLTTQESLSTGDVMKKGLGKGVSTASDRLANYLIDRAEQYQPVISIPSGIDVEVVFVEGFYFNPKEDKKPK